ncbi:MAG: acyloxyacyl hydrolase [Idiomarina sp.]|nr:acyloxyacyl hydrolase [Idiomarinaceae bacterium]MBL4742605.1 acyloxyacyl hydrolase [Idiomarina sp.]PHQ76058.1 MAG: acyloxyacyl hydrolase [Idiomarina sp.]
MKRLLLTASLVSLLPLLTTSQPALSSEIHIGAAYSADQMRGARVGYRTEAKQFDWLDWAGSPTLAFEGALNQWQNSNDTADNIFAVTFSPIVSWQLTDSSQPLFLEAGIGGSYIDQTHIGNRRLSTRFQFEDRIGLSWQYSAESDARVSIQYTHYSNADIEQPNDGLDFFSVYWVLPL